MIVVDTSALILSLTADRPLANTLLRLIDRGERLRLPALVLYEWWRGPRTAEQLAIQELLFPIEESLPFDSVVAEVAARLFRRLGRPRARQIDLAIAATALVHGAALWTSNSRDFEDVPDLELVEQNGDAG